MAAACASKQGHQPRLLAARRSVRTRPAVLAPASAAGHWESATRRRARWPCQILSRRLLLGSFGTRHYRHAAPVVQANAACLAARRPQANRMMRGCGSPECLDAKCPVSPDDENGLVRNAHRPADPAICRLEIPCHCAVSHCAYPTCPFQETHSSRHEIQRRTCPSVVDAPLPFLPEH